ncbi:MAG: hypothetical protein GKR94_17245 [Gammaproteobacteria bacterium]|nr:hypothetical protein [Gammaproteobacteria bacterium]
MTNTTSNKSVESDTVENAANFYNRKVLELFDSFTLNDFKRLMSGEVLVLRVKNYIKKDICKKLIENLYSKSNLFERFSFAKTLDVFKIGINFSETCINHSLLDKYFDEAGKTQRFLRELQSPYLCPIDKVRLDLDSIWKYGAVIPTMYGRRMFGGFYRSVEKGGQLPPHQNDLNEETTNKADFSPKIEFAQNVFLDFPDAGQVGEFQVWDHMPGYADAIDTLIKDNKTEQFVLEKELNDLDSKPSVIIKPEIGDLIIFRPKCIHRVNEVKAGRRVTSCFHFAYVNDNEPLRCWI